MTDEEYLNRLIDAYFAAQEAIAEHSFFAARKVLDELKADLKQADPYLTPLIEIRELTTSELRRKTKRVPKPASLQRRERDLRRAEQYLSIFLHLENLHPGFQAYAHDVVEYLEGTLGEDWEAFSAKLPKACARFALSTKRVAATEGDCDWMFKYLTDYKRQQKELTPEDYEDVDDGPIDLPAGSKLFAIITQITPKPLPLLLELPDGTLSFAEAETKDGTNARIQLVSAIAAQLLSIDRPRCEASPRQLPEANQIPELVRHARTALADMMTSYEFIEKTQSYLSEIADLAGQHGEVCRMVADWRISGADRDIDEAETEFGEAAAFLTPAAEAAKVADWDKVTRIAAGVALPDWDGAKHALFLFSAHLKRQAAKPADNDKANAEAIDEGTVHYAIEELWTDFDKAFQLSEVASKSGFKRTARKHMRADGSAVDSSWLKQYLAEKARQKQLAAQKPEAVAAAVAAAQPKGALQLEYYCELGHVHPQLGNAFCPTKLPSGKICGKRLNARRKSAEPDAKAS